MTPKEAAAHYIALAETDTAAAIRFAHEFEDKATEAEFDEYLAALEGDTPCEPQPFVCDVCTYPSRKPDGCDNPACLANPSLSEAHKATLRDAAAAAAKRRAEDDARRNMRASLRRSGFTPAF